jgi:hypothetical protein
MVSIPSFHARAAEGSNKQNARVQQTAGTRHIIPLAWSGL